MKTTKFNGVMENFYGYPLPKLKTESGTVLPAKLEYNAEFDELTANEEIPAGELPTAKDVLSWVNNRRKAAARQKASVAILEAAGVIVPNMKNDTQKQLKTVYDGIMAGGKRTHEEARAIAESATGEKWAD